MASLPYPLNRQDTHGRVGTARTPYPPTDCRSYIKLNMNSYLTLKFYCLTFLKHLNIMIEYSVYMTTNHLSKDEGAKAYAAAQIREKLGTDKFVAHVARHNSVFSKGTIKGVLADVACCVREQLLNGNKVQLEGLGTFGFTISSTPAESLTEFTAANIKGVNVVFTPAAELQDLIADAKFVPVSSRRAQAAVLKAEKNGDGSVDITKK